MARGGGGISKPGLFASCIVFFILEGIIMPVAFTGSGIVSTSFGSYNANNPIGTAWNNFIAIESATPPTLNSVNSGGAGFTCSIWNSFLNCLVNDITDNSVVQGILYGITVFAFYVEKIVEAIFFPFDMAFVLSFGMYSTNIIIGLVNTFFLLLLIYSCIPWI